MLETARRVLKGTRHGLGAYSESKGVRFIREAVADFIRERDGIDADPESIYLTDGASKGVQAALRILISGPQDGIMIPIPQYPLYSATITLYEGKQVGYYLDEGHDWKLSQAMLEESLQEARRDGVTVKAICVLNPGNPTGSVLDRDNIAMLIDFARAHDLAILADEVYQENIYLPGDRFVSFARVMVETGETDVSLFSFHSCSKGFLGECGQRGGYMEVRNMPPTSSRRSPSCSRCRSARTSPGRSRPTAWCGRRSRASRRTSCYARERDGVLGELRKAGGAAGRRAEPHPRHPVQRGRRGDVRVSPDHAAGRPHGRGLLHGAARADRRLRRPRYGVRPATGTAHFRTTILPPTPKIEQSWSSAWRRSTRRTGSGHRSAGGGMRPSKDERPGERFHPPGLH